MPPSHHVCVVGAGVVGLSTAVCLQQVFGESVQVTVLADKFLLDTTSSVAAGIFLPHRTVAPVGDLVRWAEDSMSHYLRLLSDPSHFSAGVRPLTLHLFDEASPSLSALRHVFLSWQDMSPRETSVFASGRRHQGVAARLATMLVQCRKYLPYLTHTFQTHGGIVVHRRIAALADLYDSGYDLIVNCTGVGAGEVCGDGGVYPVRGVAVRVVAPWVKQAVLHQGVGYVIPCDDDVVVGGSYERGSWDTGVTARDVAEAVARGSKVVPSITYGAVREAQAGLRPYREGAVRVEVEEVQRSEGTPLPIIHNYGHGANGVALSWGTAVEACRLARKYLPQPQAKL